MQHVLKYHIIGVVKGAVPYEPTDIASYTKALELVETRRKALVSAGAELTRDECVPKAVRE